MMTKTEVNQEIINLYQIDKIAKRITNRIKMDNKKYVDMGGRGSSKICWLRTVTKEQFKSMYQERGGT